MGSIQVEANDAKDTENRDKIRTHLTEIAKEFQNGIFTTPFAVHGQIPPGVPEMDKLKNEILESEYSLEYQQIAYYLMLLQKLIDILQLNFQKFCKKTVQYFIQDNHLFC